jgi:NADPH2:quinone reductase
MSRSTGQRGRTWPGPLAPCAAFSSKGEYAGRLLQRARRAGEAKAGRAAESGARPGEVLVKTHAAPVGIWDVYMMKEGFGDPPLLKIPGSEVAGVVETVNNGSDFKPGDSVYGSLGFQSGGFAEYATTASDHLARKPETISFDEAAALVIGAGTAYEGLVDRAHLRRGETALITAASGGVGTAAVQIAAAIGAKVIGLASARNHDYIFGLGASKAFDYNDPEWVTLLEEFAREGMDVLFDAAGNQARNQAITALK